MKDRASRGSASSCRTSSTASMCRSVPTAAGSMVSTRPILSILYLHLPLCLSLWLLINFNIFLPFCSRGVSVPGSFGTHLSAQCSQSHGTCPHVQYDIRKYMFLSLSLRLFHCSFHWLLIAYLRIEQIFAACYLRLSTGKEGRRAGQLSQVYTLDLAAKQLAGTVTPIRSTQK